jgi:hypothetical protein
MLMVRTPKYVKDKLIEHLETRRQQMRCNKIKEINDDFHERHADMYAARDAAHDAYEEHIRLKESYWTEYMKIDNKLGKLKSAELVNKTSKPVKGTCSVGEIHPELVNFDDYTETCIIRILQSEEITLEEVEDMIDCS